MNTKIIVALVIGMALFGLTSAVSACDCNKDKNLIVQTTDSCGLMIGTSNMLTQNSDLTAAIYDGKKNEIYQTVDQCALAIGTGNVLKQYATQKAFIMDAKENIIDQDITQAEIAFGRGNKLTQKAAQLAIIDGSNKNKILQDIDQFQLAFGIKPMGPCGCLDKPRNCNPCQLITHGMNNEAGQNDKQTAIIKHDNCCEDNCCPIVPPFYTAPSDCKEG